MTAECLNLREMFGDQYRVEFEESYSAERPEFRAQEAPWLMVIRGQAGEVFPWDESTLVASTYRRGSIAKRLQQLPFTGEPRRTGPAAG